ncbi:MAG: DNA recombination protein RmuC [Clostridia bacterium]|nr:DNA recombination protein RmuC [Clostridia bacterium]
MQTVIFAGIIFVIIFQIIILILLSKKTENKDESQIQSISQFIVQSTQSSIKNLGDLITSNQKNTDEIHTKKLDDTDKKIVERQNEINRMLTDNFNRMEVRFKTYESMNEQKLEAIRETVEKKLSVISEDNSKKLEEMRKTVDEKLQKTLDDKMNQSFKLVSERLEQVYKGLGEMQTLAVGVGDLKKVLSNVKTRGILGEIQLGAILKEILSPEQYAENVATIPKSKNVVEFAVKMPSGDNSFVYLPIDSKFPQDAYIDLQNAYETSNPETIKDASKVLETRIKAFAKDIHTKYVEVPYTTDFAVMFLPFEGLYAEAVNMPGLVEYLQHEYHVNIAGPSTMAAVLNSIQMGFKTLAIQKRSQEVWKVLGAVKSEFDKFEKVIENAQQRINQANKELDTLVGVRTRAIQRQLRNVETIDSDDNDSVLIEQEQ